MKTLFKFLFLFFSVALCSQTVYVAAPNGLNVREAPSATSPKKGTLKYQTKVRVLEWEYGRIDIVDNGITVYGRWCKIEAVHNKTITGYVYSGFLSHEKHKGTQKIQIGSQELLIEQISSEDFERSNEENVQSVLWDKKKCEEQGLLRLVSKKEITLTLSNGDPFVLKKYSEDEQFFGYDFVYYNAKENLYVVRENWLEARNPILIDGANGAVIEVVGENIVPKSNSNLVVIYGEDISAGWSPNGIAVYRNNDKGLALLFSMDPAVDLEENWGPIAIKWESETSILVKCLEDNIDGGNFTSFKRIVFSPL